MQWGNVEIAFHTWGTTVCTAHHTESLYAPFHITYTCCGFILLVDHLLLPRLLSYPISPCVHSFIRLAQDKEGSKRRADTHTHIHTHTHTHLSPPPTHHKSIQHTYGIISKPVACASIRCWAEEALCTAEWCTIDPFNGWIVMQQLLLQVELKKKYTNTRVMYSRAPARNEKSFWSPWHFMPGIICILLCKLYAADPAITTNTTWYMPIATKQLQPQAVEKWSIYLSMIIIWMHQ